MTPKALIARAETVARKLNTISNDFDDIQFSKKEELEKIQEILREIGTVKHKLWMKILDTRTKMQK